MELADIVGSIRRHWQVAIGILLLSVLLLAAFLVTRDQVLPDRRYEASVQVLIPARDETGGRPAGVPPVLLQGQAALALAESTRQVALTESGVAADNADEVGFGASLTETGDIITLTANALDVDVAVRAANALAGAYITARKDTVVTRTINSQRSVRATLDDLKRRRDEVEDVLTAAGVQLPPVVNESGDETAAAPEVAFPPGITTDQELSILFRNKLVNQIRDARNQFATIGVQAITPSAFAEVVEVPAPRTITPAPPSPMMPIAIGLGIGVLLSLAVPTLMDRLDQSIKDAKTATAAFAAPVLSSIPASSRTQEATLAAPGSEREAAFRSLATTSVATDRLPRAIVVTSPVGHIQDTVAANFAAALAGLGLKVALVATTPRQAWFAAGATEAELEGVTFPELLEGAHTGRLNGEVRHRLIATKLTNLVVIPPGSSDEPLLSLDGLPPLLDALSAEAFDVTVIAGPALLEDPNATIFAWATRSVLWAVETGEVTEAKAREAASRLALAGVTPFGVAIVGRES